MEQKKKLGGKLIKKFKYTWKEKIVISLFSAFTISFIFFLFNPIDIYSNNMLEFQFTIKDLLPVFIGPFFALFAGLAVIMIISPSILLNILSSIIYAILISMYIDNLFLHSVTFVSGDMLSASNAKEVGSIVMLVVIIYVVFFASIFVGKKWKNVAIFLSVLFIGMNGASLATDVINNDLLHDDSIGTEYALSEKDIYNVSAKENVIYIIFDRFDYDFYEEVIKAYPDYFDELEGFTMFDDCVSKYNRTFPAVANLITGVEYDPNLTSAEYFEKAYTTSPFLKDLKANGYSVNIYMTRYYGYNDAVVFKGTADNVEKVTGYEVDKNRLYDYFENLSLGRLFSFFAADNVLNNGNDGLSSKISTIKCDDTAYYIDEPKMCADIMKDGLGYLDSDKNYTFIYTRGCHSPFLFNENCEYDLGNATSLTQTVGCFKLVKEYLNHLKAIGAYDNSTIVITGDHGRPHSDIKSWDEFLGNDVTHGIRTCTFFKPKNAPHDKLAISSAPVCFDNIIPTIVDDINLKTDYDYGKTLFDYKEGDQVERTVKHSIYDRSTRKLCFEEYKINGSAKDVSNWRLNRLIKTDRTWY